MVQVPVNPVRGMETAWLTACAVPVRGVKVPVSVPVALRTPSTSCTEVVVSDPTKVPAPGIVCTIPVVSEPFEGGAADTVGAATGVIIAKVHKIPTATVLLVNILVIICNLVQPERILRSGVEP